MKIIKTFHKNPNLIGINIERKSDNSFTVSVALKVNKKWQVKTLGGISGDYDDDYLIEKVWKLGIKLDKKTATLLFSVDKLIADEYKTE